MLFPINEEFTKDFEKINKLVYFPYVGINYANAKKRILIYAHNIPFDKDLSEEYKRTSDKYCRAKDFNGFGDSKSGYIYCPRNPKEKSDWNLPYRNFVLGVLNLQNNYIQNRNQDVENRINSFIKEISMTNFINGLVYDPNNTRKPIVPINQIIESKIIQSEIIKILNPTHIICWGEKPTNYLLSLDKIEIIDKIQRLNKRGFGKAKIILNDNEIKVLKIHHPSYNQVGWKKPETHKIFNDFLN